ncbi:MAG: tetratricopeptide repeat protein [Thermoanaerobaculia bacterium]
MAELTAEARIRDLERRLDLDPGSRLFVALAEECRKLGRVREALSALQKGLLAHPGYIAAQVALGRVYLEADQTTDAIATFTKVLSADPGNLVAAKCLADVYLSRGDHLEALKKYKLYRALSSDRKVDEVIAKLEPQVAPKPITPLKAVIMTAEPPPPPPSFQETDKSRPRPFDRGPLAAVVPELSDPFDVTSVTFEPGEDSGKGRAAEGPFAVPTRDAVILPGKPPASASDAATRVIAIDEVVAAAPAAPAPAEPPCAEPAPPAAEAATEGKPTGRGLADLYYAQGHYAEALQIYDDLVNRHPFDEELKRRRRDSEARLLPAGATAAGAAPDPALDLRLARIRVLRRWLSQVQAR